MKYYAVADDPNELLHYGRLGMKWGQHIFVGPKSLSYKKAEGKLRSKIQNAKMAIQKSRTQHAINRQQRQQNKFAKAVQKAQQRIALTEGFRDLDRLKAYERSEMRAYKNEQKAAKIAEKNAISEAKTGLRYANNERKMQKYTQKARKNKLKYGKLSPDQVNQITQRLTIEANARRLGGAEETFRHRLKTATKEGLLQGVTQGIAAGMKEVAIDRVQNRLRNKRTMDKANRNEAQRQKEATRIKNKKTHKEVREDLRDEAYEAMVTAGGNKWQRRGRITISGTAKELQKADTVKRITEAKANGEWRTIPQKLTGRNKEGIRDIDLIEARRDIKKKLTSAKAMNSDEGKELGRLEAERDILKKLNSARALETDSGNELRNLENKQKSRAELDEKWRKYVDDGGAQEIYDKNTGELIDLSTNSPHEMKYGKEAIDNYRRERLTLEKNKSEADDKRAFDRMIIELKQKDIDNQLNEGRKAQQRLYESAMQNWIKQNGAANGKPKPKRSDFGTDKDIIIRPPQIWLTYEEYKRRQKAGLPLGLPSGNGGGGGKGNKG